MAMSASQENALKTKLLKLECRFTWPLRRDDINIDNVHERLRGHIESGNGIDVARSHSFLAYIKYLKGCPEEAIENLLRSENLIREQFGEDCEKLLIVTYGDLAWLHYHRRDFRICTRYLDNLERIMEKFPVSSHHHPEVYSEKGWTFLKFSLKFYDKAKQCFEKAIELAPDGSDWNTGYAIALFRTERQVMSAQTSPAINQLRRALEVNPQDAYLMVLLAVKHQDWSEYRKAEPLVERALRMSPNDPQVAKYVGIYLNKQGSVDKSIELLTRCLDHVSASAFIHHQLALAYKKKKMSMYGRQENRSVVDQICHQMIYHLEKATSLEAPFVAASAELALTYGEISKFAMAEELFHKTLETAKARNDNVQMVHTLFAQFYHKKCEPLAIKHFKEGLLLTPDTALWRNCAKNLREIVKRRLRHDPSDGEACGILGFVYKMEGKKLQAVEWYEKALVCDMNNEEYVSALSELRMATD